MIEFAHVKNRSLLHPEQHYLMFVYSGDSLYNLKFYGQAEQVYQNSLRARKAIVKRNPPSVYEKYIDQYTEVDMIYKIAKCFDLTSQPQQAIRMLELVPPEHRTGKVNSLLGRLSLQTGLYNQGKDALIQAIRECPLNFDAIKRLLAFGTTEHVFADVLFESEQVSKFFGDFSALFWRVPVFFIFSTKFSLAFRPGRSLSNTNPRVDQNLRGSRARH